MTVKQIGVIGLRAPDGTILENVPIYEQVQEGEADGRRTNARDNHDK